MNIVKREVIEPLLIGRKNIVVRTIKKANLVDARNSEIGRRFDVFRRSYFDSLVESYINSRSLAEADYKAFTHVERNLKSNKARIERKKKMRSYRLDIRNKVDNLDKMPPELNYSYPDEGGFLRLLENITPLMAPVKDKMSSDFQEFMGQHQELLVDDMIKRGFPDEDKLRVLLKDAIKKQKGKKKKSKSKSKTIDVASTGKTVTKPKEISSSSSDSGGNKLGGVVGGDDSLDVIADVMDDDIDVDDLDDNALFDGNEELLAQILGEKFREFDDKELSGLESALKKEVEEKYFFEYTQSKLHRLTISPPLPWDPPHGKHVDLTVEQMEMDWSDLKASVTRELNHKGYLKRKYLPTDSNFAQDPIPEDQLDHRVMAKDERASTDDQTPFMIQTELWPAEFHRPYINRKVLMKLKLDSLDLPPPVFERFVELVNGTDYVVHDEEERYKGEILSDGEELDDVPQSLKLVENLRKKKDKHKRWGLRRYDAETGILTLSINHERTSPYNIHAGYELITNLLTEAWKADPAFIPFPSDDDPSPVSLLPEPLPLPATYRPPSLIYRFHPLPPHHPLPSVE